MEGPRPQSPAEELANALTHGVGAVLGLAGLYVTAETAMTTDWAPLAVAATIAYGLTVFGLFGASTLYHAVRTPWLKARLQKADHCAIYLLIAGTYTPFSIVGLGGWMGWTLFGAVWALAVAGIAMELSVTERWEKVSLALYLTMGWMGVLVAVPMIQALPFAAIALIVLGGVLYTAGTWFYARDRPWDHAVWHGFVLGGAVSHAAAVVMAVG